LYSSVKRNLEWGIETGLYRAEINVEIITRFRMGSMLLILNHQYFPHGSYSLAALGMEITDYFLHGLVTPKGKELLDKYKKEQKQKYDAN
jgi:hypothetical protein